MEVTQTLTLGGAIAADPINYVSFLGPSMPYDGQWHHVILSVDANTVAGTYAVDGVIGTLTFSQPNGPLNGWFSGNIPWNQITTWKMSSTLFQAAYQGQFAEFVFYATDSVVNISSIINKFRDPSTGKALGLGANCIGPTGSVPNMCNRGDPCTFILGPAHSYVLRKPAGTTPPLLNGADTDPCLNPYSHGRGCQ